MSIDFSKLAAKVPDEEELKRMGERAIARAYSDVNAFPNWFPVVESLNIRTPKSVVVDFPLIATKMMCGDQLEGAEKVEALAAIDGVVSAVRTLGEQTGYPVFMKNSQSSNKHYWAETCFIASKDDNIVDKIANITNFWLMVGSCYSMHMVVREFIKTVPAFYAFKQMPVTEEYRLFVRDGVLEGWQPYWPEHAIQKPSVNDWRERLKAISVPSNSLLESMRQNAESVGKELGGYWSVDFLIDEAGDPWLIDMANGNQSFKCDIGYVSVYRK